MKKLAFLPWLFSAALYAQSGGGYVVPKSDTVVLKDGGLAVPSGYLTISNDDVPLQQRSIINIVGGGCVDNSITFSTDCTFAGGGGGAPTDATYITQTANGTLSAEQAIGALSSGILRGATTTGVITSLGDILPVANGGTALASGTSGGILGYTASGTLASSAALTAGSPILGGGAGAVPSVVAGISSDGISVLNLGTAGSTVGEVAFRNATSGSVSLKTTTGALGTRVISLPALGGTMALTTVAGGGTGAATFTNHGVLLGQATSAIAATSAGTSGQVLTSNGASADPTFQNAAGGSSFDPITTVSLYEEFLDSGLSGTAEPCSTSTAFAVNRSGTVAGTETQVAQTYDHPGWCWYGTGTDTTGRAALYMGNNAVVPTPLGVGMDVTWLVQLSALSDGTNTYIYRAGFLDNTTGVSVDGAWFEYTHSVNSGNWTINTANNSTTTAANTSTAVAATTWTRLRITVTSGPNVHFYVDGTEVANSPIATNIPTSAGRETEFMPGFIFKSAGTTSRSFAVDYVNYLITGISR